MASGLFCLRVVIVAIVVLVVEVEKEGEERRGVGRVKRRSKGGKEGIYQVAGSGNNSCCSHAM